jgi:hypothetical protein
MPQKKITIPVPIQFTDPATGVAIETPDGTLDFATFIGKLQANPLWAETWQAALAQRAINAAMKDANGHLTISEEDWKFLETAAKQPRMMFMGPQGSGVIPGLGLHPSLSGQVVPFQLAIINAETV